MSRKKDWIKYYVNEDKKVVVAKMNDTAYDAIKLMQDKFENDWDCVFFSKPSRYKMQDSYIASARCHEDDEFDVELGKLIARKRVLFKYYEDFTKTLQKIRDDIDERMAQVCKKPFAHFEHITEERIEIEQRIK